MAAGDGDGAGDVLGLGDREHLELMAYKIDYKLSLFKQVVVEYNDFKGMIHDLINHKEKMEQEHHKSEEELMAAAAGNLAAVEEELARKKQELVAAKHKMDQNDEELKALREELMAANGGLAAATGNLAAVEKELAQCKQELVAARQQKDEELNALRRQKSDDGLGFEKQVKKIVKEIKDFGGSLNGDLVVRQIGKLDKKPFEDVYKHLSPEKAGKNVTKLYSRWEKRVNDPSKWEAFTTVVVDGDRQEVIDENNELLRKLKMNKGEEVYNSVVHTLKERKEYNIDGKFDFLLWNKKKQRKGHS